MNTVTANELKTKGISAVDSLLEDHDEALISVRGQNKYVIMAVEKYTKLREYELAIALQEAKADVAAGGYHEETVEQHMGRLKDDI